MTNVQSEPTIRTLSLGAGVQSSTLALMAADGTLPKVDAAIFADTQWEPQRVYDHLAKLEKVLAGAGIPLYRVTVGSLREDAINPAHRYASVPYYVLNHADQQVPDKTSAITCRACNGTGWAGGGLRDGHTFQQWTDTRSDDEWEIRACTDAGFEACPTCDQDGTPGVEYTRHFIAKRRVEGMGRRQCTSEYKLAPINRKVRELLGAEPPDFRRVPRGQTCEQWIGFSTDEAGRVSDKDHLSYITKRYPLLELGMDRTACAAWLAAHGWTSVEKSACIGCPYHGNRQWRDLRDNHPDEWADAVAFDAAIRKGGARGLPLDGEAFLHRSRVPLNQAPIDRATRREWQDRQGSVFDLLPLVDARSWEDGDPDGCSPYGCRSGQPVAGPATPEE